MLHRDIQVSWGKHTESLQIDIYATTLLSGKDILEIFPYIRKEGKVRGKHLKDHYFFRVRRKRVSILLYVHGLSD